MEKIKKLLMVSLLCFSLTLPSCYTSSFVMGEGPQQGITEKGKNNFFILGLAPGSHVDTKQMAGGQEDYKVQVQQSFVDGLLGVITFGIYTPRTVKVTY